MTTLKEQLETENEPAITQNRGLYELIRLAHDWFYNVGVWQNPIIRNVLGGGLFACQRCSLFHNSVRTVQAWV
jgi:hypothetical protein